MHQLKYKFSGWIKNHDPTICCLQETHLTYEDTNRLKQMAKKIYHANTNQKNARVAILISDRANFKARNIFRDKEGH